MNQLLHDFLPTRQLVTLLIYDHGTDILCAMKKIAILKFLLLLLLVAVIPGAARGDSRSTEEVALSSASEPQKVLIGEVEDVKLVPWAITLPARIDTGAAISSLDARDVSVRNNLADFTLGKEYGGLRLRLPVVDWVHIRTSVGTEKRPVVELGLCLGSKLMRTVATLTDRSKMTYPFLVGRSALNGTFVVDTSRSRAAQPACPANL
jgi:hypothetical protein